MADTWQSKIEDLRQQLSSVASLSELSTVEQALFGKQGALTEAQKSLGSLSPEDRKSQGQLVNATRTELQATVASIKERLAESEREAQLEAERLDLTEVIGPPTQGHLHLLSRTQQALEDVFLGMGFQIAEGPEVEDDWHNFEALNFPPGHPARSSWDTFNVDLGKPGEVLMRTHTSPVQVRLMESQRPPIYAVMPGQVYRRESADARHLAVFHQIEGLVVDKGITFGDLAGTIDTFTQAYFGPGITARLRPGFFPFTEPSAEFEIVCFFCNGEGCRTCSKTGWIELGGCGMVDPNVLTAVNIDPEIYTGFAFGFGIERLMQLRHDIDDARVVLDNDVRFLNQF